MIFRSQKFETKRATILTLVVSSFYEVYAQIDREITKLLGVIENNEIECKLYSEVMDSMKKYPCGPM
jgi:hypothetical protein